MIISIWRKRYIIRCVLASPKWGHMKIMKLRPYSFWDSNFCLCAIARILSNKLHDVIIRRSYIRASTKSVFATWLYNVSITGNLIRPWTSVLIITQFKPLHNLICLSLLSIQTGSVNTPWLRPPTLAAFEVAREAEPHHARTHTPVSITTARPVEAFLSPTNHSDLSAFILW